MQSGPPRRFSPSGCYSCSAVVYQVVVTVGIGRCMHKIKHGAGRVQADVKTHCAKVEPHHGRVQRCLRKRKSKLHWDCRAQLFKDSVYNADDIRLSTVTFETCLDDKRKV